MCLGTQQEENIKHNIQILVSLITVFIKLIRFLLCHLQTVANSEITTPPTGYIHPIWDAIER
jgi:hypothetical protein